MKYIAIFESSNVADNPRVEADSYVNLLAEISRETGLTQSDIILEPDDQDGNQYDQALLPDGERIACIYTEEQYARIRS